MIKIIVLIDETKIIMIRNFNCNHNSLLIMTDSIFKGVSATLCQHSRQLSPVLSKMQVFR
mgnify:CR=1 FL=1